MCYSKSMGQMKEQIRLDRLLANSGYGSRSDVKAMIHAGEVTVNGVPAERVDIHVHLSKDRIEVAGRICLLVQRRCPSHSGRPS